MSGPLAEIVMLAEPTEIVTVPWADTRLRARLRYVLTGRHPGYVGSRVQGDERIVWQRGDEVLTTSGRRGRIL
jgi:hypothetical protein